MSILEGVRLSTHIILVPWRVRKGGSGAALLRQNPLNLVNLFNPVNSLNPLSVPECVFWSNTPTIFADFVKHDTLVQWFVEFFLYPQLKHITFESLFGRLLARITLKSRCFSWEVHEKVKTTSSDSSSGLRRL